MVIFVRVRYRCAVSVEDQTEAVFNERRVKTMTIRVGQLRVTLGVGVGGSANTMAQVGIVLRTTMAPLGPGHVVKINSYLIASYGDRIGGGRGYICTAIKKNRKALGVVKVVIYGTTKRN